MYYTYILLSENDNKFYIGFTKDLKKRIKQHINKEVISTSKRGKLNLVMYEAYISEQDARSREKFFKTTKGKMQLRKQLRAFLESNRAGIV